MINKLNKIQPTTTHQTHQLHKYPQQTSILMQQLPTHYGPHGREKLPFAPGKKTFSRFSQESTRKSQIRNFSLSVYWELFSGVFSWVHQSQESVGFFSLFFHWEFLSPVFWEFFWGHQCLVFFKFFSLFYITVDNPGESCDVLRVGSNDE